MPLLTQMQLTRLHVLGLSGRMGTQEGAWAPARLGAWAPDPSGVQAPGRAPGRAPGLRLGCAWAGPRASWPQQHGLLPTSLGHHVWAALGRITFGVRKV